MRTLISRLCLFIVLIPTVWGADLTKGGDVAYYTDLRMKYAARPDFSPNWEILDERKAIVQAYRAGDLINTMMLGKAWLDKVPVDADVYLMLAMVSKEQGDFKGYCDFIEPFYGLLQSITSEGDGHTPETAFKVISVSEEYFLLKEIGAKVRKQSLVGHCDKIEIERRGDKLHTVYFDVRISLEALNRALTKGVPAKGDVVK